MSVTSALCFGRGIMTPRVHSFCPYSKRTQIKRVMKNFPAAPPLFHTKRNLEFKVTSDSVYLSKRSRLSTTPASVEMSDELRAAVMRDRISLALSNSPLNLVSLLESSVDINSSSGVCVTPSENLLPACHCSRVI